MIQNWKAVRNITLSILIVFLLLILTIGLGFALDDAVYPEPVYGLTRWKSFCMTAGFITCISGLPLLVDAALLILSIIKIRRQRNG